MILFALFAGMAILVAWLVSYRVKSEDEHDFPRRDKYDSPTQKIHDNPSKLPNKRDSYDESKRN